MHIHLVHIALRLPTALDSVDFPLSSMFPLIFHHQFVVVGELSIFSVKTAFSI